MYCSTCGIAVAQGLSYCNQCGAKLNREDNAGDSSQVKAETIIRSMAAVFVFGLFAITILLGVMKEVLRFDLGLLLVFAMLSFLMLFVIQGVLIRLLFRSKPVKEISATPDSKSSATKQLDPAQARLLGEPLMSVTENTTRAFDQSHSERVRK